VRSGPESARKKQRRDDIDLYTADKNEETTSVLTTTNSAIELRLIDFEDALPFGLLVKHAANYRSDPSYPDYQFDGEVAKSLFAAFGCFGKFDATDADNSFVQVAEKRHNDFFFHSIAAWLQEHGEENALSFSTFMCQLPAESREKIIELSR
jgi:hypothetical protein